MLALSAAMAGGFHVYATALNDMLDVRHDRLFSPQRPVASGHLSLRRAAMVATGSLLIALLCCVLLGRWSILFGLAMAGSLFFYNVAGKYVPGVGLLMLGVIRALCMLIVNPEAGYLWPLWLAASQTIVSGGAAYVMEGKRPSLTTGQVCVTAAGWAFGSLAMLSWIGRHGQRMGTGEDGRWIWPTAAVVMFALLMGWWIGRGGQTFRQRRARGRMLGRLGIQWLVLYDMSWLLGMKMFEAAAVHGGLLVLSVLSLRVVKLVDAIWKSEEEEQDGYVLSHQKK